MSSITLTESVVSESEIAAGDSAAETTVTLTNSGRVNVHMTTKK